MTIVTMNAFNLFDHHDDPYHEDEGTRVKPRHELEMLASTLRTLNADVVAMQEIENRWYLERFVDLFLGDMGYEVVLIEGNDKRGIDCAVLTRLAVGPVTTFQHLQFPDSNDKTMRFRRDLLKVTLAANTDKSFDLYVVHLKSKGSGPSSNPIRYGEAREIRRLLDKELSDRPDARFLICGDFNDTPDSPTLSTIIGSGPTALVYLAKDLTDGCRITFNREPHRSMVDYFLCSPNMAEDFIKGTYFIKDGSVATHGSDHNPVIAQFRRPEAK